MSIDDPAYPFLAVSGIPSVSFHFISPNVSTRTNQVSVCSRYPVLHIVLRFPHFLSRQTEAYTYYSTKLDNVDHLNYETGQRTSKVTALAAQFAGQMALRLTHDRLIRLDVTRYGSDITDTVTQVYRRILQLSSVGLRSLLHQAVKSRTSSLWEAPSVFLICLFVLQSGQLKGVSADWLIQADSAFQRAARGINTDIERTDLDSKSACRILNDRLMKVRRQLWLLNVHIKEKFPVMWTISFYMKPVLLSLNLYMSYMCVLKLSILCPRLSTLSSLHTCPPSRPPSVTSCMAGVPTLWHPSPRPVTWSSFTSRWPWLPGPCRDVSTPWWETYGMSVMESRGRRAGEVWTWVFFVCECACVCVCQDKIWCRAEGGAPVSALSTSCHPLNAGL